MASTTGDTRSGSGIGFLLLGLGLMYLLDPESGRRRRARLRDQVVRSAHKLRDAERVMMVDAAHRVNGLVARAEHFARSKEEVDDAVLAARVRAAIGRYVSHPHAIEVGVERGNVVLKGVVLADELGPLLRCVQKVRGVKGVENRLNAYPDADGISALQGGKPRHGPRAEWLQRNWSPTTRLVAFTVGTALALRGLRGNGVGAWALRAAGSGLLARAVLNRRLTSIAGLGPCEGILVDNSVHVAAPVERVFETWRNFENFPHWMSHVIEVRQVAPKRYRWVVDGPAALPVEWESEVVHEIEPHEMAWRSKPGSLVNHAGRVRFDPENGGTRIQVQLCYMPIGGMLGHAVAKAFGTDPKSEMDDDLMRLKTLIETGHPPHDAGARRLRHRAPARQPVALEAAPDSGG